MIDHKAVRFVIISVSIISIIFGILSYFKIHYQFYVWEIFVDLKILSLLLILFWLKRKNLYQFFFDNLHLRNWDVKKNLFWFVFPVLNYVVVIISGLISRQMHIEYSDNAVTLILAAVFDIPAIYVFSATSILIEEIFFRVLLFDSLRAQKSFWFSAIVTSLMWCLFSATEIINLDASTLLEYLSVASYFVATGLFCTIVVARYKSVWVSYSFRIGVVSLTSLILPSLFVEADSFFGTKLTLFFAEGFIVSSLMIVSVYFVGKSVEKVLVEPTVQILRN
jgi:membrane protease YdiL (CAAX protease family)